MDETPQSDELVLDGLDDITIELKTESENGGGDEEQVEPEGEEKVEEQEEEEKQEQEEQKKEQDNNNDEDDDDDDDNDDDDEGSSPSPKKEKGGLSSLILNTPTNPTDDFDQQAAEWDAVEAVQQQQLTYEQEQDAAGVKGKIKSADIRAPGHLLTYLDASRYFFEELNPLKDQRVIISILHSFIHPLNHSIARKESNSDRHTSCSFFEITNFHFGANDSLTLHGIIASHYMFVG
eukprot:TRINITY_DN1607_c0_g2_i8.p1 TRINITY_DN1607_c0_g2~~TRINITY_DN1607_c0_g2_i8.p1  ORF type:complete len:235 (-),score=70.42 TRINITY_DN1607_c0_g2_i8:101-805(-)